RKVCSQRSLGLGVWIFFGAWFLVLEAFFMTSNQFQLDISRRTFLGRAAYGLGGLALATLLDPKLFGSANAAAATHGWKGIIDPPHFPVRVKRIIHLCMAGGPSHLESFDYKPELKRIHGQPFPESFTKGQQLAQLQNTP